MYTYIYIYICIYIYIYMYLNPYMKHILCMGLAHAKDMFHIWKYHIWNTSFACTGRRPLESMFICLDMRMQSIPWIWTWCHRVCMDLLDSSVYSIWFHWSSFNFIESQGIWMDIIDLAAPGYHLGRLGSFLGVPWDHFRDHWIHFSTPGALKSEPKLSRRPFGLPRSSFEEFGTDFGGRFFGFCYSCTFLNGFLKSGFWILRQLYVFDDF